MEVSPTLYIGIGKLGIKLVAGWIDYLRFNIPEMLPLVNAQGYYGPEDNPSPAFLPRTVFDPVSHKNEIQVSRWLYPANMEVEHYTRLVDAAYHNMASMVVGEGEELFEATDRPRIVMVGQLSDDTVKPFLTAKKPDSQSFVQSLWQNIVLRRNLAIEQRDIWIILFVDEIPDNPKGQTSAAILKTLEKDAHDFLSENRQGFNILLISSRSSPTSDQDHNLHTLWSGDEAPWDGAYCAWCNRYGQNLLHALLFMNRRNRDVWFNENARTDYGIFSTISLTCLDSSAKSVRRAAMARANKEILETKQLSAVSNPVHEINRDMDNWIKKFDDELSKIADTREPLDTKILDPDIHIPATGSLKEVLEEIKAIQWNFLEVFYNGIIACAKKFNDIKPGRENKKLKRECDHIFRGCIANADDHIPEDIKKAANADGPRFTETTLSDYQKKLTTEADRIKLRLPWPPTVVCPDEDFEELDQEVKKLSQRGLPNLIALCVHGIVATLMLVLGTQALVFTLFYGSSNYEKIAVGSGAASFFLPTVCIAVYLFWWHRKRRRIVAALKAKYNTLRDLINKKAKEHLDKIGQTHINFYRVKLIHHFQRLFQKFCKNLVHADDYLAGKLNQAKMEIEDHQDEYKPARASWLRVFCDMQQHKTICDKTYEVIQKPMADSEWEFDLDQIESSVARLEGYGVEILPVTTTMPEAYWHEWLEWAKSQLEETGIERPALPIKYSHPSNKSKFVLANNDHGNQVITENHHDLDSGNVYPLYPFGTILVGRFWMHIKTEDIDFGAL